MEVIVQPPAQDRADIHQADQDLVQLNFEYLQGQIFHNLSECNIPTFGSSYCDIFP